MEECEYDFKVVGGGWGEFDFVEVVVGGEG